MKKIYYIPQTELVTFSTGDGIWMQLATSPNGEPGTAPGNRRMVGGAPWRRVID